MVALVAVIELIAAGRNDLADPGSLEWRFGDRAAWRKAPEAAVLCLGGSQMRFGLAPAELESRLARPVRSLALTAAPPPVSYFLLRHALRAGARPEALLVDFSPYLLVRGPRTVAGRLPEVASLRDGLDLGLTARDPDLLAELFLAHLLPSTASRRRLRTALGRGDPAPDHDAPADPVARKARWLPGGDARIGEVVYPEAWDCPAVSLAYVRRLLDLADGRRLPVYWLMTPSDPEILAERERRGLEARYTRFARGLQAEYPGLTILDGRALDYAEDRFTDPVHLNRAGASAFTAEVASALASPPGPRWVDLAARPATAMALRPSAPRRR